MKTEKEIKDKIKELEYEKEKYSDDDEIMQYAISSIVILKWVLK